MPESKNILLAIPVYNEADNLGTLLQDIDDFTRSLHSKNHPVHLILVDDGSNDNTSDLARAYTGTFKISVLTHEQNRGPGAAFATAFTFLADMIHEGDMLFTLEGDNTSRLSTALRMLTRAREGYDVVLASPYAYGGGFCQTATFRVICSHIANGFLKSCIGIHGIHTASSFFRLYTAESIIKLQTIFGKEIIESSGFECMVEMLFKMTLLRMSISEVEMRMESWRRQGPSKMKILRTSLRYLSLFYRKRKWEKQADAQAWGFFKSDDQKGQIS